MIDSKDVSVVLQGAIDYRCTSDVVRSVRKFLPDSELIVSTWKNDRFGGGQNAINWYYLMMLVEQEIGFRVL